MRGHFTSCRRGGNGFAATVSATTSMLPVTYQYNLKAYFLKGKLVACSVEESHGSLWRFESSTELDANGFTEKMRELFPHFPVKDERDIRIEFFLQLPKLVIPVLPRAGFEHRQHQDILSFVVGKGIQCIGPFNSRAGRRRKLAIQIFVDGNHM